MATVGGSHKTTCHHKKYVQEEKEKGRATQISCIKISLSQNEKKKKNDVRVYKYDLRKVFILLLIPNYGVVFVDPFKR